MPGKKEDSILKSGFWIKEQNGVLTMGDLEKKEAPVIINNDLADSLISMADEIYDALYSDDALKFNPKKININLVLEKVEEKIDKKRVKTSIHCTSNAEINTNYEALLQVFSGLAENSARAEDPMIYINASVVGDELSVIYRDSGNCADSGKIKKEIEYIKNALNGEVKINDSGKMPYLDILIPGQGGV